MKSCIILILCNFKKCNLLLKSKADFNVVIAILRIGIKFFLKNIRLCNMKTKQNLEKSKKGASGKWFKESVGSS